MKGYAETGNALVQPNQPAIRTVILILEQIVKITVAWQQMTNANMRGGCIVKISLQEKLYNSFPNFFYEDKERFIRKPIIECGDGWFNLLVSLCIKIELELIKSNLQGECYATQLKEKFGGLRVYKSTGNEKISHLIHEAERKSYTICEMCGQHGKLRNKGWLATLCDEHAKEQGYL